MTTAAAPVRRAAPPKPTASLDVLVAYYRAAVREFIGRADAIDAGRWEQPRAAGKWTPAQEAEHIGLAYGVIVSEFEKGQGFKVIMFGWKRWLIRLLILPRILRGHFPIAARAPREVRPAVPTKSQAELLEQLRANSERSLALALHALDKDPSRTCAHPYFGSLTVREMLVFASVHTLHHADFLPPARPTA